MGTLCYVQGARMTAVIIVLDHLTGAPTRSARAHHPATLASVQA
jgi:hypothetical protein